MFEPSPWKYVPLTLPVRSMLPVKPVKSVVSPRLIVLPLIITLLFANSEFCISPLLVKLTKLASILPDSVSLKNVKTSMSSGSLLSVE